MNILTFDIEEWYVYKVKGYYGTPADYLPRIQFRLNQILDLLDKNQYKATFFCLGELAKDFPQVVKLIDARGHHVGCHSHQHHFIEELSPKEFAKDTYDALSCIQDVIGKKVDSYRAPAFSITETTRWALDILIENGIEYDCSIFPSGRRFGGFPSIKSDTPMIIQRDGMEIKEFPVSVFKLLGLKTAYSGGGYFRLLPYPVTNTIFKHKNYNMAYFHIRDFDEAALDSVPEQKIGTGYMNWFRNFYGIKGSYEKFEKLVDGSQFLNIHQADKVIEWNSVPRLEL